MSLGVHLARWDLVPDGEPITTPSSFLLPVRRNGVPAMLKIAREDENAIIQYADDTVATTYYRLGRDRLATMTDEEILADWNEHIEARDKLMRSYEYVTVEVPRDIGPDAPRATWKFDGTLRVTTSDNEDPGSDPLRGQR